MQIGGDFIKFSADDDDDEQEAAREIKRPRGPSAARHRLSADRPDCRQWTVDCGLWTVADLLEEHKKVASRA